MSIEKVHSGATLTFSQQGTCGGILCGKVTLFIGECHFIQMPRLKKKKALCCVQSYSVMNVCMFCRLLPLVVCPFMHSKSPMPDCQHATTLCPLTYARPFSSAPPGCINQIPCSTSVRVILSPEGKPCEPDLHQSTLVLPRPSTPKNEHPDRMTQTAGSMPSFTPPPLQLENIEGKKGVTMLNISCFPLGNSVWLEQDLVFHRYIKQMWDWLQELCVSLYFLLLRSKIGLGDDA